MPIKVEDWIPQEPWQGPPLPEFLNIYWPWYTPPGAEFRVNNLVISPEAVYPGQPVTISATVTNTGSIAGDYTVKLGGDFTGEQSITLEPTESETISFEVVPTVAKTYSITVDGLHGTFRATEAPVEVIDFELTRPSVSPATITPGTSITITCPITSACTKSQTITVKVIIYEGSILPGHGAVIATKTSPSFSIAPDQTYNVIVHHTAIAGTIDRRDIEVEVYIAGKLVKESEWDDVYYVEEPVVPEVPEPVNVLSLPYYFNVVGVEGVPFSSVSMEPPPPDWEAFGRHLQQAYGAYDPAGVGGWIADGVGLALCMSEMNLPFVSYRDPKFSAWGFALYNCGLAHPEYLTEYAKRYSAIYGTNWAQFCAWGYSVSAVRTCYGSLKITLGGRVEDLANIIWNWDCGSFPWEPCANPYACFPSGIHAVIAEAIYTDWLSIYELRRKLWPPSSYRISDIATETSQNLEAILKEHPEYLSDKCRYGSPEVVAYKLMYYLAQYRPPPSVTLTYIATLSQPIVMNELRGVTLNCLYRHQAQEGITVSGDATFWPQPTFPTELGPPAFRGNWSFSSAQDGKQVTISIPTCFGAGYYYPGLYDGKFRLAPGGSFVIKNLAEVTGEGTVSY